MKTVEIVESTIRHAYSVAHNLREDDKQEALRLGINPVKGVFYAYRTAFWRRTALVDGVPAAMWGLTGNLLGPVARPYFVTTPLVETVSPLVFMRVYKKEVQEMQQISPFLEDYVDANYYGAIRALKLAGFKIAKPVSLGPEDSLFCRFSRST